MQIPFVGPAYRSRSLPMSAQRSVNLYLQTDEGKGGKSPIALFGTPGMLPWVTIGALPIRALFATAGGWLVAVSGDLVYRVDGNGAATQITAFSAPLTSAGLQTSAGPVSMDENGQQLMIVDGSARYAVDLSTWTLSLVSTDAASSVTFIDGYFVVNRSGSQQFDVSEPFSTVFDPTSFASAEGSPDLLQTVIADHRELWLFSSQSTEVWSNTGNLDFPFERIPSAFMQVGCVAPASVARMDNSLIWLGADRNGVGMVWRAEGYRAVRISTAAIEREIQSYTLISDAQAFAYQQDGHTFYVLSFPTADRTWVFDAATQEWHERGWFDALNVQHRHRASCAASFNGRLVVGDAISGVLCLYDLDHNFEVDVPMRRIRTAQPVSGADYQTMTFSALQIDFETGVGLQLGQGSDPVAMLRMSNDGGRTWSSQAVSTIGSVGQYRARARWRRLGRARERVFEVSVSDPVRCVILGAALMVDSATS
jgi:hypothetical protein